MHSVSPVRIRVDNNIKNPMISKNFEDLENKVKKKVKIGPSTIINNNSSKKTQFKKNPSATNLTRREANPKSRSLSPKTSNNTIYWSAPAKESNPRNESKQIALKPISIISNSTKIPPCETCIEARSRSISPCKINNTSPFFPSSTSVSSSSSSNECINPRNRSYSPFSQSNQLPIRNKFPSEQNIHDINLTYTMVNNNRSRSHESVFDRSDSFNSGSSLTNLKRSESLLLSNKEKLIQKLIESESYANDIVRHLSLVKDFIRTEANINPLQMNFNPILAKRFENDRNILLKQLELFELSNRELKDIVYDLTCKNSNNDLRGQKRQKESTSFLKQIDSLENENMEYRRIIMEMEKSFARTGSNFEELNIKNNALVNLKTSLEENRARLRRQLLAKESEVDRLNVQIRTLTNKLERAQLEISLLRANREKAGLSTLKFPSKTNISVPAKSHGQTSIGNQIKKLTSSATSLNKNIKLTKHHYNIEEILSDPVKTRLYIEKLNNQIRDRDMTIKNLNQVKKQSTDSESAPNSEMKSERSEVIQSERLRRENEKLKLALQVKEEKLKTAESKLKSQDNKKSFQSATSTSKRGPVQKQNSSSSDDATTNFSQTTQSLGPAKEKSSQKHFENINEKTPSKDEEIQRETNFTENELNYVRSRLQERLNELEPLPELLKNTELKLHEAMLKIKSYELESLGHKKTINDLKSELELAQQNKSLMAKVKESKKAVASSKENLLLANSLAMQAESNAKQQALLENISHTKLEPLERRIKSLEDENKELLRQLSHKDDIIRDLTSKLSVKANEASSYSRQLEMALSDAKINQQQIVEKSMIKERLLQAKCSELETKLNTLQLHSNVDKRDKQELSQDYVAQIKDLKARLEQCQLTNKQLQDYINFLKNSYVSYFNENAFHSFDSGSSSNILGSSTNNNLF